MCHSMNKIGGHANSDQTREHGGTYRPIKPGSMVAHIGNQVQHDAPHEWESQSSPTVTTRLHTKAGGIYSHYSILNKSARANAKKDTCDHHWQLHHPHYDRHWHYAGIMLSFLPNQHNASCTGHRKNQSVSVCNSSRNKAPQG